MESEHMNSSISINSQADLEDSTGLISNEEVSLQNYQEDKSKVMKEDKSKVMKEDKSKVMKEEHPGNNTNFSVSKVNSYYEDSDSEIKMVNPIQDDNEKDYNNDDSDFGSFDDASLELHSDDGVYLESEPSMPHEEEYDLSVSKLTEIFREMSESIFPEIDIPVSNAKSSSILTQISKSKYQQLQKAPYLDPLIWGKSSVRHKLFVNLGIPINLDETNKDDNANHNFLQAKTKSIKESEIDWSIFKASDTDINLSEPLNQKLMIDSSEILSNIETDILRHSTRGALQGLSSEVLEQRFSEFETHKNLLNQLGNLWKSNLDELKKDFEMYESLVQNFIGYTQKIKREELLAEMKKLKKSKRFSLH